MFNVLQLLSFLVLEDLMTSVTAVSTASGTEFLITTPGFLTKSQKTKIPSVYLHIYTEYTTTTVQVQIMQFFYFTQHNRMDNNISLFVNFNQPKVLYIEQNYYPEPGSGVIPIICVLSSWPVNIMVSIHEGVRGQETFKAVPVAGWGRRYHAVTFGYKYSLVVMTSEEPNIITLTFQSNRSDFSYNHSGVIFKNGHSIQMQLFRLKPYAFSSCDKEGCQGSLTGSTVIGEKPIGIVTGNCRSLNDGMVCQSEEREEENYIVEMMLPQETYGRQFILIKEIEAFKMGYTVVIAGTDNTMVHTYKKRDGRNLDVVQTYLRKANDWTKLKDYISYINASHGVLVVYVQSAKTKVGGPSFLQIIPMELFYFKYMIIKTIIFSVRGKDTWKVYIGQIDKNSIFVVLSTRGNFGCYQYGVGYSTSYMHSSGFISSPINNDIQSCAQTRVRMAAVDLIDNDCDGQIDEEVANGVDDDKDGLVEEDLNAFFALKTFYDAVKVLPGRLKDPLTTSTASTKQALSTTTAAKRNMTTTKTAAPTSGRLSTKRNVSESQHVGTTPTTTPMSTALSTSTQAKPNVTRPFESFTGDNKFLVKGLWSEWRCSRDCRDSAFHRERDCVDDRMTIYKNCDKETKLGTCYIGTKCPAECSKYQWGVNCQKSCINCAQECDKFDGKCSACKPGFRNPTRSCNETCPNNRYGENCEGNCIDKCGSDCTERVTGSCVERATTTTHIFSALIAFLIVVLVSVVTVFALRRYKMQDQELEWQTESDADTWTLPGETPVHQSSLGILSKNSLGGPSNRSLLRAVSSTSDKVLPRAETRSNQV
ncbi:uncharacterized protein LOC106058032 isoform X2 [Biomphalaria glabrata]|uniref:Uncharacterized protein LOC106058032 isoform X2 n=1 Tax=Biomphalaria glabrata TaxID=6526 RepID=A0A9W2ZC14_BIOGL|nr:uncharacterized protein LOC106058032 isoform X2 [Biomphalaria glabrata]